MQPPTRLFLIRQAKGLRVEDVASFAGVSTQTIRNMERGLVPKASRSLLPVALALNVTPPERLLERTWDLAEVQLSSFGVPAAPSLGERLKLIRAMEAEEAAAQRRGKA